MGFPRISIAKIFLKRTISSWNAYLHTQEKIFSIDHVGRKRQPQNVDGRQVEFFELPELAKDYFGDVLSDMGIALDSPGLKRLPDLVHVCDMEDYSIWKKRVKMRRANYRVLNGKEEVGKFETLIEAKNWVKKEI